MYNFINIRVRKVSIRRFIKSHPISLHQRRQKKICFFNNIIIILLHGMNEQKLDKEHLFTVCISIKFKCKKSQLSNQFHIHHNVDLVLYPESK